MKGAKCRYNEYHRESFRCSPRINERLGTIIGEHKDKTSWRIVWDDAKGVKYVSKSFIQVIIHEIGPQLTELNNIYNSTLPIGG